MTAITTPSKHTHIVLVLDETGSMQPDRDTTVSALKEWLGGLKADHAADTPITFVRFHSNAITKALLAAPIGGVGPATFDDYAPNYMTPLYDAVGQTIAETERVAGPEDGVIFTILTDGLENASTEFKAAQVKESIERLQAKGWKFMFIGAEIDAYATGRGIGISDMDSVFLNKKMMHFALKQQRKHAKTYADAHSAEGARAAAHKTLFSREDKEELGDDSGR